MTNERIDILIELLKRQYSRLNAVDSLNFLLKKKTWNFNLLDFYSLITICLFYR